METQEQGGHHHHDHVNHLHQTNPARGPEKQLRRVGQSCEHKRNNNAPAAHLWCGQVFEHISKEPVSHELSTLGRWQLQSANPTGVTVEHINARFPIGFNEVQPLGSPP